MRQIKNKNNFQASVSNMLEGPSVNKLDLLIYRKFSNVQGKKNKKNLVKRYFLEYLPSLFSAIYSQLGNAYFYLGDYVRAMQYHKHDLTLARTMGDRSVQPLYLRNSIVQRDLLPG